MILLSPGDPDGPATHCDGGAVQISHQPAAAGREDHTGGSSEHQPR